MKRTLRAGLAAGAATAVILLAGCGGQAPEAPPIEVTVAPASVSAVQLTEDIPGRVVAVRVAEIRPQVGGIIQRRLFTEGAVVRAGQPLFQINPAPFRADADSAAAALRRAEVARDNAKTQVERLRPLVEIDAVSRQAFDDASAAMAQAEAEVGVARATLARRRLDVGYSTVTAPIGGLIGASTVTEGALVGQSTAEPLAVIHQINQVYVDVNISTAQLETLRNRPGGQHVNVEILGSDGQPMGLAGRLLFSELVIDQGTGNAKARVLVDNPGARLLPGMFVRARIPLAGEQTLVQAPQQAVFFIAGKPQVMVAAANGQVSTRAIEVGPIFEGRYTILSGVNAGENVIVEGRDRVLPETPVRSVPWRPAPARGAAPEASAPAAPAAAPAAAQG